MIILLLFLMLFALPASAADAPDWRPLEVTVEEEEEIETPLPVQSDGLYKTTFEKMSEDAYRAALRRLKVENRGKKRRIQMTSKETVLSDMRDAMIGMFPGGLEGLEASLQQTEDQLYDLIIKMPPLYYQYIGPFLHDAAYAPERILNIPGIKETKDTFPTRIAPQMQEYVKKYGKHMSKHYYLLLMPEAWERPKKENQYLKSFEDEIPLDGIPRIKRHVYSLLDASPMPDPKKYQNGSALKKIVRPQTPKEQVTATSPLTEGDVEAALASFETINAAMGTNRFDDFHSALRRKASGEMALMEELRNPFKMTAEKIQTLPEAKKFAEAVAKHGFTIEGWGYTVDKILKARRVATMSPTTAYAVADYRKYKKKLPPEFEGYDPYAKAMAWESLKVFVDMYTSPKENVLAVKNYGDKIRKVFTARDSMILEAPVVGVY